MVSNEVPDDPLRRFSLSIFTVYGLLMESGDRMTRSIGQSSARWQVLGRAGYEAQTVANMAREMGHARQSVQRVADVLERDGLVVYKDNPSDRRAKLVELTPQAVEVVTAIYALQEKWTQHLMDKLDPEQLSQLADALENIGDILESSQNQTD